MFFVTANVLQPLIDVFEQVLLFFHDQVGLGWGLSIVAMTVFIRALLLPLAVKQMRSMQAMQKVMPEIKALQAKYKDDKQRLNQETMKLYQEKKVNPFASCLPLLLQMPVFISLFYMLRKDLKVDICPAIEQGARDLTTTVCEQVTPGSGKFLFIPDLTDNATGAVLAVLIVLYVGSQLLSSLLMTVTADKNQRYIMLALPFVFTVFIINFPAGLLVYWITTNFWTVSQQYALRKILKFEPPPPLEGLSGEGGLFGNLLKRPEPATAGAGASGSGNGSGGTKPSGREKAGAATSKGDRPARGATAAPPPPPRGKKKKRSGRRR